jgi:hypothetical protein
MTLSNARSALHSMRSATPLTGMPSIPLSACCGNVARFSSARRSPGLQLPFLDLSVEDVFHRIHIGPQIGRALHVILVDLAAYLRNFGLHQLDGALDQTLS